VAVKDHEILDDVCIPTVIAYLSQPKVIRKFWVLSNDNIRATQTGVFDPDIRLANRSFIRLYKPVRGYAS
jgi:hypothetical protein